jgi:sugar-specific transcriptional regulator TrmB
LNHERILKALVNLGLSQTDAQVYIYLATKGPQRARKITEALRLHKQKLYRSLKSLQCKGCAKATLERPALFSATSPERVLDILIKAKMEQAKKLQANREELLSLWQSMTIDYSSMLKAIDKNSQLFPN